MFDMFRSECAQLITKNLPIPAYDYCLKCSHTFNLLDARGVIGVSERETYIAKVRALAKMCAESYLREREELGFPLTRHETWGKN